MIKYIVIIILFGLFNTALAAGTQGGIPVAIMKSDYASLHLTYIALAHPVPAGNCTSGAGLVIHDSNESSKVGVSLALTALASGKRFQCYVTNTCSRTTGALTTYPVCEFYPSIHNQ